MLLPDRIFNVRIKLRNDSHSNWAKKTDFVPMDGEIVIYDIDNSHQYQLIKIGDGITKLQDLPFINEFDAKNLYTKKEVDELIAKEASTRKNNDVKLQTSIDDEIQERKNEDERINTKLNNLNPIAYDGNVKHLQQDSGSVLILDCK